MLLRKIAIIAFVVLSTALFINGVSILASLNATSKDKSYSKLDSENDKNNGDHSNSFYSKPVNIVIFGLDDEGVRSDTIVLLNVNEDEGRLNILSIARDTRICVSGRTEKINALIAIGTEELAIQKITELTGLPVHFYVTLNFKGFREIIDALDGVEMDVPFDMDYDDPEQDLHIHLKKGRQVLHGKEAEGLVRYRKGNRPDEGYTDGDIGRIRMQQEFMKALLEQKLKLKYLMKVDEIFLILKKYMRTNIEMGDVSYHLKGLRNMRSDGVKTYILPGDSVYMDDLWYYICDREKTRELIERYFFK